MKQKLVNAIYIDNACELLKISLKHLCYCNALIMVNFHCSHLTFILSHECLAHLTCCFYIIACVRMCSTRTGCIRNVKIFNEYFLLFNALLHENRNCNRAPKIGKFRHKKILPSPSNEKVNKSGSYVKKKITSSNTCNLYSCFVGFVPLSLQYF